MLSQRIKICDVFVSTTLYFSEAQFHSDKRFRWLDASEIILKSLKAIHFSKV